ncbi:MAG: NAD(P)-binding domain-containing protein, partial [Bacteroidota bacterium]
MKILIIGGGNMGLTYAKSFLKAHVTTAQDMMILEKSPERAHFLSDKEVGTVYSDPAQCIPVADLIVLAVKPQDIEALFAIIRP